MNYYNDNDPKACAWLKELIAQKVIPAGEVDERCVTKVRPSDLKGFFQCHFFAGIGGWAYALELAQWDFPCWTASLPCQPFSYAGEGLGTNDPRHLWPTFRSLASECRPTTIFGEQVASEDGKIWLSGVRVDLEALGYACGGADLCAGGIGSPNIRQRLWWVAHAHGGITGNGKLQRGGQHGLREKNGRARWVAHTRGRRREQRHPKIGAIQEPYQNGATGPVVNANGSRCGEQRGSKSVGAQHVAAECASGIHPFWNRFEIIPCQDGKVRRVEPGSFPLVDGIPGRVGLLRGYGNAINPQVAAEFVSACKEIIYE